MVPEDVSVNRGADCNSLVVVRVSGVMTRLMEEMPDGILRLLMVCARASDTQGLVVADDTLDTRGYC